MILFEFLRETFETLRCRGRVKFAVTRAFAVFK
jgi:hypothetical protein